MIDSEIPISSKLLGYKELEKSPIYDKIPKDKREYYVEESLEIGKNTAKQVQTENKNIYQLLDDHKIVLEKKRSGKILSNFTLRGEINFSEKKCKIIVYEESIEEIFESGKKLLPKQFVLSKEQALEVHLSHEYFHYLEFISGKTVSENLGKIRVPLVMNLTHRVDVIECSEIAAHSFAKQFCHLDVLPNYYDLQYTYHQNYNEKISKFRREK